MTIDVLPTIARLIDARLPSHRIDGKDIWPIVSGDSKAKSPHEAYFYYYNVGELQAVRSGRWKLVFPHTYRTLAGKSGGTGGNPAKYESTYTGLSLFDLEKDSGEKANLVAEHPDIVRRLQGLAERSRADLGDSLVNRAGNNLREPGRLAGATPQP